MIMFGNSRYDQSGIDYNSEYYGAGTTFDRVGRRMNRHSNNQYGGAQQNGYYDARQRNGYSYGNNGYGYGNGYGNQYAGNGYGNQYADNGYGNQQDEMIQQRNERVEQIVFNSAVPSGDYYNLNDPKNDIRSFAERRQNEN